MRRRSVTNWCAQPRLPTRPRGPWPHAHRIGNFGAKGGRRTCFHCLYGADRHPDSSGNSKTVAGRPSDRPGGAWRAPPSTSGWQKASRGANSSDFLPQSLTSSRLATHYHQPLHRIRWWVENSFRCTGGLPESIAPLQPTSLTHSFAVKNWQRRAPQNFSSPAAVVLSADRVGRFFTKFRAFARAVRTDNTTLDQTQHRYE